MKDNIIYITHLANFYLYNYRQCELITMGNRQIAYVEIFAIFVSKLYFNRLKRIIRNKML